MKSRKSVQVIVEWDPLERRAAVLEDGKVVDLEIERDTPLAESIFKGIVKQIVPGIDAAFVDLGLERLGFLPLSEIVPSAIGISGDREKETFRSINEAVKVGDEVLVQISRYGGGTKGVSLTTAISLRGRYCVLVCQGSDAVGVSHQIMDEHLRSRLRRLGEQLRPLDCGLILRHHAVSASFEEIAAEVEELRSRWHQILLAFGQMPAPSLLHQRPSFLLELIWDLIPTETDQVIVDGEKAYKELIRLAAEMRPELLGKITSYTGRLPIFEAFNVEPQIKAALARQVYLPNGGYLVIDETEGATVIDVNTGRFVGHQSAAETILETNLEAVEEVARQMRLRDLGGVILVDLVDVLRSRDRQQVLRALERAIRKDRKPVRIIDLTPLGMLEITRLRQGPSYWKQLTKECEHCGGRGRVKSAFTVSREVAQKVRSVAASDAFEGSQIVVVCHPEVGSWLVLDSESIKNLEERAGRAVILLVNWEYPLEKFLVRVMAWQQTVTLVGRRLLVDSSMLLPPEEPTFAVCENRLVRLPDGEAPRDGRLLIVKEERWWCESRWDAEFLEQHRVDIARGV
ncbi:MAG: Rne/Rng family ribonuclease [Armatimonadetes bacterium]|nr:Rne/Rng family ribonuclease [Armatimonadota bacterium]MDW8120732.1 Rne/Rng family ribonuclease [Armatimonadota bacterium]